MRLPSSSSGHERGRRGGAHNAGEAERGQGGAAPDEGLSSEIKRWKRVSGRKSRIGAPRWPPRRERRRRRRVGCELGCLSLKRYDRNGRSELFEKVRENARAGRRAEPDADDAI